MKQNFYKKHKKTFSRALVLGIFMSGFCYIFGILLVDVVKFPFYIAGLIITPVTFLMRYIINKFWIFKESKDE